MSNTSSPTKDELRVSALRARRALNDHERARASAKIALRVVHRREFSAAQTLACYLPMHDEVDPSDIIARAWRAKKRVFAPVIDNKRGMTFRQLLPETRLERNCYGLWEPVDGQRIATRDLDLVVTPVVAFDAKRNRIGMGGGYFDRCFAFLKPRRSWLHPKLIGVAFDCQRAEKIESSPWDIPLYRIISEISQAP